MATGFYVSPISAYRSLSWAVFWFRRRFASYTWVTVLFFALRIGAISRGTSSHRNLFPQYVPAATFRRSHSPFSSAALPPGMLLDMMPTLTNRGSRVILSDARDEFGLPHLVIDFRYTLADVER